MTQEHNMIYALVPVFIIWFIHRPFINKLDLIKYVALGCISFVVSLFINYYHNENIFVVSAISAVPAPAPAATDQTIFIINNNNINDSTSSTATEAAAALSALDFYKYLFMVAIKYLLISIFTVSITCLFTRWHFPITFINPNSAYIVKISKYVVSFFLFGSAGIIILISSQTQKNSTRNYHMYVAALAAAVMGALWFISGLYFLKRWKAIIIAAVISTLFALFSTTTLSDDHDTATHYQLTIMHWSIISLALVLSCNTLDHLDAILNTFPHVLKISKMDQERYQNAYTVIYWSAMLRLVSILLFDDESFSKLNPQPIEDLETAIRILGPASRSWKTMAALFPVNLRQDLCLLYAFFRTADDLVDDAATLEQGEKNLMIIRMFLQDIFYASPRSSPLPTTTNNWKQEQDKTLPPHINWTQYAALLPYNNDVLAIFRNFARISHYLCPRALFELTNAWEHDLEGRPVKKNQDLLDYAAQISGTFGELCTCVIMYKTGRGNWGIGRSSVNNNNYYGYDADEQENLDKVLSRARSTGQCLQLINIARDIIADSLVGRCYVPLEVMPSAEIYTLLTHAKNPFQVDQHTLKSFSLDILDLADQISARAQKGMDGLPKEVQNSIRAAFFIYMAIGTTLRNDSGYPTRAKVPKWKQEWIAFCCIYIGVGGFWFSENNKERTRTKENKEDQGEEQEVAAVPTACEIQL